MVAPRLHVAPLPRHLVLIAALLLAAFALLVPASPASAHDELIGSSPAADTAVDALPAELTLTFSGAIATDEGASEVAVTDASGAALTDGAPSVQDNVLTQPLSGEASGAVTVLWKVVSSDGHPISGEFTFTVTAAATPSDTATPAPTPSSDETTAPTTSPTPSPTSVPAGDGAAAFPWILLGILAVALAGGVVYLLVSRARRERALAETRENALGGAPGPDSDAPAGR